MGTRVGIVGSTGRMGKLLTEAILGQDATLVGGVGRDGDLAALAAESDVIVDFTVAAAVKHHAEVLTACRTPWVLGTTGLSVSDDLTVRDAAATIPVFQAANFAPGVNLILAIAERLAAYLPGDTHDAEILEMHHRQKVDAPSGTALALGRAIAQGRGVDLVDVMELGRHGHTGPRAIGNIGFAVLRGGQVVGSHSAIFTSGAEQIVLAHHALDRRIFADGALRAAMWLANQPPGYYGMRDFLGV